MVLRDNDTIWIQESIGNLTLKIQPSFRSHDIYVEYTTNTINAECGEIDESVGLTDFNG